MSSKTIDEQNLFTARVSFDVEVFVPTHENRNGGTKLCEAKNFLSSMFNFDLRRRPLIPTDKLALDLVHGIAEFTPQSQYVRKVPNVEFIFSEGSHVFDSQIFMGSGDYALRQSAILKSRLEAALSTLSGAQQNGGMGYAFNEESDRKDKAFIFNVVGAVAMA